MGRDTTVFEWDDFRLDTAAYRLERAGVHVPLEPKAFDVLALLVSEGGRLFTKQDIFDRVWPDTAVTDHALTRVIAQLRRALGDQSRDAHYIETVPTRGYRWMGPVRRVTGTGRPSVPPSEARRADDGTDVRRPQSPPIGPTRPRPFSLAAAAVLLTVIGGTLVWQLTRDATPAVPAASAWNGAATGPVRWPTQITTHAGLDLTPALSPRGDALAFASDRSGGLEIYVRSLANGGTEVALTDDGGENVQPAWSPDGTQLAFHSAARGGIWLMPARGGTPRQIVAEGSNPAWSPDGTQLAYQSDEHVDITPSAFGAQAGATLWTVGTDGRAPRALTRTGAPRGGHASPTWSPDARFVGFTTFDGGQDTGAWLVRVEDGQLTRLTEYARVYELVFAPDGSALYAAGGEALLYRIPFDAARGRAAGPIQPVPVAGVPAVRGLSIAGDGSRVAFAGMALNSQIWAQATTSDGSPRGEAYRLTDDTSRRNWMAVVSPDGRRVAYMSSRRGEAPNVWLMAIDGSGKTQLSVDQYPDGKPHWYPDSRRLAYFSFRNEASGLWAMDVDTRRETLVFDAHSRPSPLPVQGRVAEIELAPSMTRGAFSVVLQASGLRRVFVMPFDGTTARATGDEATWAGYPVWSRDEQRLAVEVKDGSSTHAAVVDVASGALRRLTHDRGQTWVRSWSPDGTRIAAAVLRQGRWGLRWIDAASGTQGQMMASVPPNVYVRYPDWSPRGDVVVFERGELRGNIWSLPVR